MLREGLDSVTGEGCYYFSPDIEGCAELSWTRHLEMLLCQYAATHDISPSLGLRLLCGPVSTEYGPCCFGIDANIVFQ